MSYGPFGQDQMSFKDLQGQVSEMLRCYLLLVCQSLSRLRLFVTSWTGVTSGSSVHGILQTRIMEWVSCPSPGGLPDQGTEPVSLEPPALTGRFFTPKLPGKPKNTGVGSLSLLQWIFPTQESNQGLLHCRRILYQLSYKGSPLMTVNAV